MICVIMFGPTCWAYYLGPSIDCLGLLVMAASAGTRNGQGHGSRNGIGGPEDHMHKFGSFSGDDVVRSLGITWFVLD